MGGRLGRQTAYLYDGQTDALEDRQPYLYDGQTDRSQAEVAKLLLSVVVCRFETIDVWGKAGALDCRASAPNHNDLGRKQAENYIQSSTFARQARR
jgi:hypothetical protein